MKSRELLEKLRKGQVNEKMLVEALVILNEKCEANERNLVQMSQMLNKMTELITMQLTVVSKNQTWLKGLQDKGILPREVDVASEGSQPYAPGITE